jgi:hypothetical protein
VILEGTIHGAPATQKNTPYTFSPFLFSSVRAGISRRGFHSSAGDGEPERRTRPSRCRSKIRWLRTTLTLFPRWCVHQDQLSFCGSAADTPITEQFRSFCSHNATVLRDLAIIDWHSGGVQAIDISDATHPKQAGFFMPQPIPVVGAEDPALSVGPATTVSELLNPNVNDPDFKTKVVMWSYPIMKDGLVYVIEVGNGLYILRYTGPHSDQVENTQFREGNSTVGNNDDEGEGGDR